MKSDKSYHLLGTYVISFTPYNKILTTPSYVWKAVWNTVWSLESDCFGSNIQLYQFSCFRTCTDYLNGNYSISMS